MRATLIFHSNSKFQIKRSQLPLQVTFSLFSVFFKFSQNTAAMVSLETASNSKIYRSFSHILRFSSSMIYQTIACSSISFFRLSFSLLGCCTEIKGSRNHRTRLASSGNQQFVMWLSLLLEFVTSDDLRSRTQLVFFFIHALICYSCIKFIRVN